MTESYKLEFTPTEMYNMLTMLGYNIKTVQVEKEESGYQGQTHFTKVLLQVTWNPSLEEEPSVSEYWAAQKWELRKVFAGLLKRAVSRLLPALTD